jgi:hypothetical protein
MCRNQDDGGVMLDGNQEGSERSSKVSQRRQSQACRIRSRRRSDASNRRAGLWRCQTKTSAEVTVWSAAGPPDQ